MYGLLRHISIVPHCRDSGAGVSTAVPNRSLLGCMLLVGAFLTAPSVSAQGQLAVARKFYQQGLRAEKAEQWEEAAEKYRSALDIKETPQLWLRVGICFEELGRLTSALDAYERGAEQARLDGKNQVVKVLTTKLEALRPKVPTITLVVADPPAGLRVTIDGEEVATAALGTKLPIDPGEHTLNAAAPGYLTVSESTTIAEGHREVSLSLEVDPNARKTEGPEWPRDEPEPILWPGAVVTGVGGVGLVVGGVLLGVAQGKEGDVDERCGGPDRLACPQSEQADIEATLDGAEQLRIGGFVSLGVGGAAAVAGVVLLVLAPGRTQEAYVLPTWGPRYGGVTLGGRF